MLEISGRRKLKSRTSVRGVKDGEFFSLDTHLDYGVELLIVAAALTVELGGSLLHHAPVMFRVDGGEEGCELGSSASIRVRSLGGGLTSHASGQREGAVARSVVGVTEVLELSPQLCRFGGARCVCEREDEGDEVNKADYDDDKARPARCGI